MKGTLTYSVTVRWWILRPYMQIMNLMVMLYGREPNYDRVASFIGKYCVSIKPVEYNHKYAGGYQPNQSTANPARPPKKP